MKRYLGFTAIILVLLLAIHASPQTCGFHCGTARWKVKTLTDTTVENLDSNPIVKSIHWLRTRTRPSSLPNTKRLIGIETMTFKVTGVVLKYKFEANDNDFHVVIAQRNNHNRTMIIEFPDPECASVCESGFLNEMRQARADFIAHFGEPTGSFTVLDNPVLVEVIGVGFFDKMHGQIGRALPSGIELHPVLSFRVLE